MQIVIEIPEKDVPNSQEIMTIDLHFIAGEVCGCSYPYMVLPKGHGRLIDADELEVEEVDVDWLQGGHVGSIRYYSIMKVSGALTIVEADGGDVDENRHNNML